MTDSDFREPHLRHADFLGAFGVIERDGAILLVANRRVIGGKEVRTWDLPGGQIEIGELTVEGLRRELNEELGIVVQGSPRFLFLQEGERCEAEVRSHAWRSFFFEVVEYEGEPVASGEIEAVEWFDRDAVIARMTAPYHDSFCAWLQSGGTWFDSRWRE